MLKLILEKVLFRDRRYTFAIIVERANLLRRDARLLPPAPVKRIGVPAAFELMFQLSELEREEFITS